ncbi:MAG: NAD(P)/FAD-dependent oxidoreductase [Woeseiaceae bacterium]|nr:NAD(P)/FAD-dependent oxidoreductase [Woeseiaceae bacterium]
MSKMKPSTLRIGRRYRPNRLAAEYDAIVIGSGMGGLTTAALLSEVGWRVCVLEQHYTAGGYTHSYERNGYEWDVGLHYIGDVGAPTRTRKLFDFLSNGKLRWAPMDDEYDRFYVGDHVYSARAGKTGFRDNLVRQFPDEESAIDAYMELLKQVGGALSMFGMGRVMKPWMRTMAAPLLKWKTPEVMFQKTYDVLSALTDNQDLIAVICGQWGDMGVPPKQSPFMVHAMIARHYLYGGFYPVGGSWQIADSIIPKIQSGGGEVFTYAHVEKILVDDDEVRGVRMSDGHEIDCPVVISSAGVDNTFNRLLPDAVATSTGYKRSMENVRPSVGHLCLYIGLQKTAEDLGLPKTNFWIYPHNDYDKALADFVESDEAPFPVVYISFPSAKDPDYLNRHPGTTTIEIVAPAPYRLFEEWKGSTWGQRGEDYDALKDSLSRHLLAHLYDKLPQLEGEIDYYELSTPLSTEWFSAYQHGELYGLDHTPERLQQDWLTPKTRIDGLWLTGQDILTCGVTGAMMSGVLTVTAMLGMRRVSPLMKLIFG